MKGTGSTMFLTRTHALHDGLFGKDTQICLKHCTMVYLQSHCTTTNHLQRSRQVCLHTSEVACSNTEARMFLSEPGLISPQYDYSSKTFVIPSQHTQFYCHGRRWWYIDWKDDHMRFFSKPVYVGSHRTYKEQESTTYTSVTHLFAMASLLNLGTYA